MGRRHGNNATNSAVYTYHERARDAKDSGFGTEKCRLSKDSLTGWDCCSLTLQPCRTPLVSPQGFLFDKEALLKYMIGKKQEYARKLKEYERQKDRDVKDLHQIADAEKQSNLEKFEKAEKSILPKQGSDGPSTSKGPALPSFWIPSLTPQASKSKVDKPDKTVYCPVTSQPLKFKDMIEVKFTLLDEETDESKSDTVYIAGKPKGDVKKKSLIAKEERYKCAVTHDILNNGTPVAVLRPTGDVVTVDCVEKIIKKDMLHPLTGIALKEKDIIYLQRGGTGYAATNEKLKASHYRPNLAIA